MNEKIKMNNLSYFIKRYTQRSLCILSIATMISLPVTQAHAGQFIQNVLNEKLSVMSNYTQGAIYESSSRTVFSGPSVSTRNKIFNKPILTLAPPSFSAGCGGIDLFGGSFSFINKDQLIQLFRSIASNAVSFLFQISLCAISPEICETIKWFQELVQKINNLLSNSCQLADGITKAGYDAITGFKDNRFAKTAMKQNLDDAFGSFKSPSAPWNLFGGDGSSATDPNKAGNGQSENKDGSLDSDKQEGNIIRLVLKKTNLGSSLGNCTTSNCKDVCGEVMSMTGAYITTIKKVSSQSATGGTNASDTQHEFKYLNPTLSMKDFVQGSLTEQEVYSCNDDECAKPTKVKRVDDQFLNKGGMKAYVERMLCGANGMSLDNYGVDQTCASGILHVFAEPNGGGLTETQKNFISQIPAQMGRYLPTFVEMNVNSNGTMGGAMELTKKMSGTIATYIASDVLLSINTEIRKGISELGLSADEVEKVEKALDRNEALIISETSSLNTVYPTSQALEQRAQEIMKSLSSVQNPTDAEAVVTTPTK